MINREEIVSMRLRWKLLYFHHHFYLLCAYVFNVTFCVNVIEHVPHLKKSGQCVFAWTPASSLVSKRAEQMRHLNGFTLTCFRECTSNAFFSYVLKVQMLHEYN